MEKIQNLIQIIQAGQIGEKEKKEWESFINASPEEVIEGMLELFTQFPGELEWIDKVYKRKKEAFRIFETDKKKGQEALDAIYHEERERLDKLLGN